MRSSSVRFSIIVASACAGFALAAGATRTSHAATYYLPASFAPSYYWTTHYPVGYYASPVVYSPSAYYLPTDYSRYYSTSLYVPTYYEPPTVWSTSYVPPSPCVCAGVVAAAPLRIVEPPNRSNGVQRPIPLDREPRGESTAPSGTRRPESVEGDAGDDGTISSKVKSPPDVPRPQPPAPNGSTGSEGRGSASGEGGKSPALESAPKSGDQGTSRRDSFRYTPESSRAERRNVLCGKVETNSGDPREGVRVAVSSRTGGRAPHYGISDAFGNFAIKLEDGDWSVEVTMPSGRVYSVRQVSVTNGQIIDNREQREIPNLIITY